MAAQIKFVQGVNAPPGGQALQGVTGDVVQASHSGGGVIANYNWQMIDVPPGSSVPTGPMGNTATVMFTSDVPGGYLLLLSTTDSLNVTTTDIRAVLIPEDSTYNRIIAPFNAPGTSMNVAGQSRGWSPYMEDYLHVIDRLRDVGGSAPTDGEVLKWNAANQRYEPGPELPSGAAGGDLSGAYPNPTVSKVKGTSITTAGGALAVGLLLMTTAAGAADWQSLSSVTASSGVLPAANQAAQVIGGDGSGTTAALTVTKIQNRAVSATAPTPDQVLLWDGAQWAPTTLAAADLPDGAGDWTGPITSNTVVKINGASVPASGTLTTGNSLYVSGPSALSYSALNLGGGAGWVTGVLPAANQQDQVLGQDLSGVTSTATVVALQGHSVSSAVPSASEVLAYTGTMWAPTPPGSITAGGVTPGTAGQVYITNSTPAAAWTSLISVETTHGRFTAGGSGTDYKAVIGPYVTGETVAAALYLLPNAPAPSATNYTIAVTSATTFFNTQTSTDYEWRVAGTTTIASLETSHGRFTAGGGGTDAFVTIGPSSTPTSPAIYALPNGTAISGTNYLLTCDGLNAVINAPSNNIDFQTAGGTYLLFNSSGGTNAVMQTVGMPLTLGTNVAGGTVTVQVDTAGTWGTMAVSGLSLGPNITPTFTTTASAGVWRFTNNVAGVGTIIVQNTNVGGYSLQEFHDSLDAVQASFGYYSPNTEFRINGYGGGTGIAVNTYFASSLRQSIGNTSVSYSDGTNTRASLELTHGRFTAGGGGTDFFTAIGPVPSAETTLSAIWVLTHGTALSSTNYAVLGNGSDTVVNAPSGAGGVYLRIGNTNYFEVTSANTYVGGYSASALLYVANSTGAINWTTTAAPLITQDTPGSDGATNSIVIRPQAPFASATVNTTAGDVIVNTPASVGTGNKFGGFKVSYNSTPQALIGAYNNGSYSAVWLGSPAATPSTTNYTFLSNGTGYTALNGNTGNLYLAVGNINYVTINSSNLSTTLPVICAASIQSDTTQAQLTIGTNKTGASLVLQAGAATTLLTGTSSSVVINGAGSGGFGNLNANSKTALAWIDDGAGTGIQLFTNSFNLGGGVNVLGIANATTVPTTNPSSGGILYAEAGAGKWRGSSGTTTTFGPADLEGFKDTSGRGHCPSCGTDFAHEWHNEKYGHLTVCMKCLTDEIGERPWIVRKAA